MYQKLDLCTMMTRNLQYEALAGIPVTASHVTQGDATIRGLDEESNFRLSLAMFLIGAEKHSRFQYNSGFTCVDPNGGAPGGVGPPQFPTWSADGQSCNWLWRPEWNKSLGAPLSWGRWDPTRALFTRKFEHLALTLDCGNLNTSFDWH